MGERYYHFKGNSEDIINSILSLLVGKEYYQEASFYANFLNDTQTPRYRKKLNAILDLMQRENLILMREDTDGLEAIPAIPQDAVSGRSSHLPSPKARIYLRQHGKQVLSEGGYKRLQHSKKALDNQPNTTINLSSKLAIVIFITASILCSI